MIKTAKSLGIITILYFLLGFPLFYYVYKFGNPSMGTNDFFSYYRLYKDWDFAAVESPFNMRLLSSFLVYLFNTAGLHYNTVTAFDQFGMDRQVFFNAILFNFLCVIATCVSIHTIVKRHFKDDLFAFLTGLVYLLGFGTIFFELMPITDALSVFIFSVTYDLYLSRRHLIILPLLFLIFQREYIFLALGLISLIDWLKFRVRYFMHVFCYCACGFVIYYILRKTVFYTPMYDFQASPDFFAESVLRLKFPLVPYLKQMMMTMNLSIVYVLILIYKRLKRIDTDNHAFLVFASLLVQINLISIAAVFGNNVGRYFYILVPFVLFQSASELAPMMSINGRREDR
jgi:hypothetical protein